MSIEELKELYINKNENAENETLMLCKSIFKGDVDPIFGTIAINYLYELIKLFGDTGNYNEINVEQIKKYISNEQKIRELLNNSNEKEYQKLKEFINSNDLVKEKTYELLNNKLLDYKLEQWKSSLNKEKKLVKIESVNNELYINKLNNHDILRLNIFGKEKELEILCTGDSKYNESGYLKENDNFELSKEEIDMINWFINNVKIDDYKKEIVDYCNTEYNSWVYSNGTHEGPIGIEDLEKEVNITAIAINITKNRYANIPEISFYGDCNCDEEHGICIGFRDKKFLGIASTDWTL